MKDDPRFRYTVHKAPDCWQGRVYCPDGHVWMRETVTRWGARRAALKYVRHALKTGAHA